MDLKFGTPVLSETPRRVHRTGPARRIALARSCKTLAIWDKLVAHRDKRPHNSSRSSSSGLFGTQQCPTDLQALAAAADAPPRRLATAIELRRWRQQKASKTSETRPPRTQEVPGSPSRRRAAAAHRGYDSCKRDTAAAPITHRNTTAGTMAETASEIKLFGKWTYDDVEVNDISLEDYIAVKGKHSVYLPHTAGRYQKKRFRKALCPITERLACALMRKGRNNGKKLKAVRVVQSTLRHRAPPHGPEPDAGARPGYHPGRAPRGLDARRFCWCC